MDPSPPTRVTTILKIYLPLFATSRPETKPNTASPPHKLKPGKLMTEPILTAQQQHVLALLAQGSTVEAAAEAVGVHRNTLSNWRRAGSPEFRNAWQSAQIEQAAYWRDQLQLLGDVAVESLLHVLQDPKTSPSVRLKASLAVLNVITAPAPAHKADESITEELHIPEPHIPAQSRTRPPDPLEELVKEAAASAPRDLAQICTKRHPEKDRHILEAALASLWQCPGLESVGVGLFSS
jgi:hypothetical protein